MLSDLMKISKNIFIYAMLVALILVCISAVSAEDNTLHSYGGDVLSVDDDGSDFKNTLSSGDDVSLGEKDDKIESDSITCKSVDGQDLTANVTSDADLGLSNNDNYIYEYNFFDFFDENGCLYDNLPFTSLTFADTFENLNISKITIKSPMIFTGYSNIAIFNNIAFDILSDNVSLSKVTLNYDSEEAAISVFGNDVILDDLTINYETKKDTNSFAVYVSYSKGFNLENSVINFISNSIGTKGYYQHAIELRDCERAVIRKNTINSELPACDVVFEEEVEGIDHDLVLVIGIQNGDDITLSDNIITTMVTGGYGELPTLDSIMADGFKNLKIIKNTITQTDVSNAGSIGYSYAIDLYDFKTSNISLNNILVNSTAGVDGYGSAYPIQLSGPYTNLVVESNNLTAIGKGPALGIFSQNSAGSTDITVLNNLINVTGYASKTSLYSLVSGMELQDSLAKVYNNTIYTESIDEYDDDNHLYGISYAQWFTNGHRYDIRDNTVITGGKYAVYLSNAMYSNVTGNDLRAHKLFGDDSVEIKSGDNNTVEENIPPYEAEFLIDNSNGWIGFDKTVTVTIPYATTGNVAIIVNGKDYRGLKLVDYSVSVIVDAGYIVADALNNITVLYSGDDMVLSGEEKATFRAFDGKITNVTFSDYFDAGGNLYDFVPEGAVLNFEGSFVGAGYSVYIDRPVNIITSSNDALFEGDLLRFTVGKGADHTNLTGIIFVNADLSVEDASYVTIDNVNMDLKESGYLSVDSNSYYNIIKNSVIESSASYAIDLTTSRYNNVIGNYLISDGLYGDAAVNSSSSSNVIKDNVPADSCLKVSVADINVGETALIDISLKSDINDDVMVIVDGDVYFVPVSNGKGQFNVSGLTGGKYRVGVKYFGNWKYGNSTKYATFNVKKVVSVINLEIGDIKPGEDVTVSVAIADATGSVIIVVNDVSNVVDLVGGTANYTINAPQAGDYSVVAIYPGDDRYDSSYAASSFKLVDLKTQFTNITIDGDWITAYLVSEYGAIISGAPVKYLVNDVEFKTTTSKSGSVLINGVADSTVLLKFDGAAQLLPCNVSINLKNVPSVRTSTELLADDFTQYSCDYVAGERGGYFKVQLKDVYGKPLTNKTIAVGFNGVVGYYQTDSEGWIQKQIALQNAGVYTFASIFLGDDDYTASFIVNKITIIKKPTSISASAKSYKASATTKSYFATLKTVAGSSIDKKIYLSAGKKITFTVNGKTYTAKTDSGGKAKVNLKLTKKGTYTVKVNFAGDGAYNPSSASAKITIK